MTIHNKSCTFIFYLVLCIVLFILAVAIPIIVLNSYSDNYNYSKETSKKREDSSLDATYSNLQNLAKENAYVTELDIIAIIDSPTSDSIPVYELKIKTGKRKPMVLILSGFNTNDWISVKVSLFVIEQIARNCKVMSELLTRFDFSFVPVWNPLAFNSTVNLRRTEINGIYKSGTYEAKWENSSNFTSDELTMMENYFNKKKNIKIVFILASPIIGEKEPFVLFPYPTPDWMFMEYLTNLAVESVDKRFKSMALNLNEPQSNLSSLGQLNSWIVNYTEMGRIINIETRFGSHLENATNTTAQLENDVITMLIAIIKECYVV